MTQLLSTHLVAGQAIQTLWHQKSIDGRLPARAAFSIDDLRPWLGRLILTDILPGLDLYYRVHGTRCAELLGQELTGKRLSDLQPPEIRERVRAEYAQVIACRRPMVFQRLHTYGDRGTHLVERILLPLSHTGDAVDQILSLADWVQKRENSISTNPKSCARQAIR